MNKIFWQKFFRVFSAKERMTVLSLVLLVVVSLVATVLGVYYSLTKPVPIPGGDYSEGIIGQPMYVNPVLEAGNEADADLSRLIYSGLFKYGTDGKIVPDLAESYEVSNDQLTYTVHLKKDVKWHDGEAFSSDDVLFTIQAVQDPAFKSPLRQNWQGVGMEQVDDSTVKFVLPAPYIFFLNNLTVGIIPKHVWETVAPTNFSLAEYNLKPVGTGPFEYSDFQKDSGGMILSYKLISNPDYFGDKPYLGSMTFQFYPDEDSMIEDYNNKKILATNSLSPEKLNDIKSKRSANIISASLPRYFAVFFNQQKSKVLSDKDVRKALATATNRKDIVDKIFGGQGREIFSPIPPGTFGATDDVKKFDFNPEAAKKILDDAGWKSGSDGMRAKNGQALQFTLVTTDWPQLVDTANILKSQWEAVGAKINIDSESIGDVQQNFLRPREYEAFLFGQSWPTAEPDPYSFWHSSQTKDPGLNLALYSNPNVDKILEKLRTETDEGKRVDLYKNFQQSVTDDIPAVFLYSPNYLAVVNKKVGGINITSLVSSDEKFADAAKWYVNTKRVRK
ncbi:MAG TPA: peptide ABC transporter substrate-binding protein [Candidatus Saccharimonadales bacterium]|jgi:peptide/nickel transport system substrate-binding protein|nr:peptide ABC transporter substrate-binding protein [Candidatus Saccharimonadales bacterium]